MNADRLFEALADETRRRILALLLARGELCVCDLFGVLKLPQPKVSRHLAIMRDSGLLMHRKQGTWVHYRLNPEMPLWAGQVLSAMADGIQRMAPYCDDQQQMQSCCGPAALCVAPNQFLNAK